MFRDSKTFILFVGFILAVVLVLYNIKIEIINAEEPGLIITEVMYDLEGSDDKREWIEIKNISDDSIELTSDWRFYDGSSHLIKTFQGGEIIASNNYAIIVDDGSQFLIDYPEYSGIIFDSIVKLSNTSEEIKLSFDKGENWLIIFEYNNLMGGSDNSNSLALVNDEWQSSLELYGSPGIENECEYKDGNQNIVEELCDCNTSEPVDQINNEDNEDIKDDTEEEIINQGGGGIILPEEDDVEEDNDSAGEEDVIYSNKIIINELLPDPAGSDEEGEFIELFNLDNILIDLTDWKLTDGSKNYILNTSINPNDYTVITRIDSKITLNNSSGDKLSLLNPDEEIVDEVSYDKSVSNNSYSYNNMDNAWQWTELITAGFENEFIQEDMNEEEINIKDSILSKEEDENDEEDLELELISNIKDRDKSSEVFIQGIVTAMPNLFSITYFYVSEIDFDLQVNLSIGIQIYNSKKLLPDLSIGDVITIRGVLSETGGEKRIKTSSISDIQIVANIDILESDLLLTGEINDDYEGGLITISGDLIEKKSTSWYVDDDTGEIRVYISSKAEIEKPTIKLGQMIMVTGIVSETKSGFRLMPRFTEDIKVEQVIVDEVIEPEVNVINNPIKENIIEVEKDINNEVDDVLGYGLGVVGLTLASWVIKLKFL